QGENFDAWYCIQPSQDGLLDVTIAVAYQTVLYLYESDGTTLLTTNANPQHAIDFGLGPGTYYVKVHKLLIADAGPYTLTNTFTPPAGGNDIEHNDSAGAAQALPLPSPSASGHLGYHWDRVDDNRDYFRINPASSGTLDVTVTTDGFPVDLRLRDAN